MKKFNFKSKPKPNTSGKTRKTCCKKENCDIKKIIAAIVFLISYIVLSVFVNSSVFDMVLIVILYIILNRAKDKLTCISLDKDKMNPIGFVAKSKFYIVKMLSMGLKVKPQNRFTVISIVFCLLFTSFIVSIFFKNRGASVIRFILDIIYIKIILYFTFGTKQPTEIIPDAPKPDSIDENNNSVNNQGMEPNHDGQDSSAITQEHTKKDVENPKHDNPRQENKLNNQEETETAIKEEKKDDNKHHSSTEESNNKNHDNKNDNENKNDSEENSNTSSEIGHHEEHNKLTNKNPIDSKKTDSEQENQNTTQKEHSKDSNNDNSLEKDHKIADNKNSDSSNDSEINKEEITTSESVRKSDDQDRPHDSSNNEISNSNHVSKTETQDGNTLSNGPNSSNVENVDAKNSQSVYTISTPIVSGTHTYSVKDGESLENGFVHNNDVQQQYSTSSSNIPWVSINISNNFGRKKR